MTRSSTSARPLRGTRHAGRVGRAREAGLTLLEVLAAAMIFALVMTVLISTSSTAVHRVGQSARRLEASLVADEILADLEIQMKQGIAPEIDEEESVRDPYEIRVVRFDLLGEDGDGTVPGDALDVAALLGTGLPEVAKHLKQYDIEVSWIEQGGPQSVTRTTFAYDWELAALEFSELFDRTSRNAIGTNTTGDENDGAGNSDGNGNSGDSTRSGSNNDTTGPGAGADSNRGNGHNARLRALARDPVSN
jgi:hypothetical protein